MYALSEWMGTAIGRADGVHSELVSGQYDMYRGRRDGVRAWFLFEQWDRTVYCL